MGRRFNNLDAALKYLRPPGATEEAEIPDAPAGTQLRQYQDFKAGKRVVSYTRAAASLPGNIDAVSLLPFALPTTNTTRYLVDCSFRSIQGLSNTGLTVENLNIDPTPDESANLTKLVGFTPARAVVKNVTGTTASPKTSKITGDAYKAKAGASYTLPFGRSTDKPSYSQVKGEIVAAVANATGNKGVSFKPENYR
jgi:hypothetical protein